MKTLVVDLLPLKTDGSNGGNSLFILSLLKKLASKNIDIQIICGEEEKLFIQKKLASNSFEYLINLKNLKFFKSPESLIYTTGFFYSIIYSFTKNASKLINYLTIHHDRSIIKSKERFTIIWRIITFFLFIQIKALLKIRPYFEKLMRNLISRKYKSSILLSPFGHFLNLPFSSVTIIYDLQHIDLPHLHNKEEIRTRDYHYQNSIVNSSKVITISNFCKKRIVDHYKINHKKVYALHLPILNDNISDISTSSDNLDLNDNNEYENFFFIPSNLWSHKNHKSLFIAINKLVVDGYKDICFVFSGMLVDRNINDELTEFIKVNKLEKNIFFLGYINMNNLQNMYRKCRAVICPSLYEGYGMTVNEANFYKKPCLASDIDAHREIANKSSTIFFNPQNPNDIYEKIKYFLSNPRSDYIFSNFDNQNKIFEKYIKVILENPS